MSEAIRIGIVGHGNLGRGVEASLNQNPDMQLTGVFTRRDPAQVTLLSTGVSVYPLAEIGQFRDRIDVLILCGGSKSDLRQQGPALVAWFNTVDGFDTHSKIPTYFAAMDAVAQQSGKIALISIGWDPGLFSLNRLYGEVVLPHGATYTFWGKGLSQGHSDAIRRVPGVAGAVQYTVPVATAVQQMRSGALPQLTTRAKHTRDCYVVLQAGADEIAVRREIIGMPDYFVDYDTTVHFISAEELQREHSAMPHGGFVLRSGKSGLEHPIPAQHNQVMEYSLRLDSNPEFTASVLVAYARAAFRLQQQGQCGARTAFDVAPGLLSPKSAARLRKELL